MKRRKFTDEFKCISYPFPTKIFSFDSFWAGECQIEQSGNLGFFWPLNRGKSQMEA